MHKPKILLLGKLPPPYIGPAVATKILLDSKLKEDFMLIHLDTSDHRDIDTLGVIDFQNIFLVFKHYFFFIFHIIKHWPHIVYIPIGQTTLSYSRDAFFVLVAKLFRRKVVCHLRGGYFKIWYNSTNIFFQRFVRFIHSLVDAQIVLGEKLKELFNDLLTQDKVFVVPNGGDYEIHPQRNHNKIKVLFLANFIQTKGVIDTLKSAKYVYSFCKQVEFIFSGSWSDKQTKYEFESFLSENPDLPIVVKGPVYGRDKFKLLASSDIFIFPTYYRFEGHPWVIVEAMAASLPIISTDQGAITESVIDGVNGFIVRKQNPQQIADKIKILIDNAWLREKMGKESFRIYKENCTASKMLERMTNVFKTVLDI